MRLVRHLCFLLGETVRYGLATRRASVVLVVALGLLLLAITVATQAAAPLVLYPFA